MRGSRRRSSSHISQALPSFLTAPSRWIAREKAKAFLLATVADTGRGLEGGNRAAVETAVDELAACGREDVEAGSAPPVSILSGTWKLLWTSERETLFLLEKGLFNVGPARDVFQVLDAAARTLSNVVEFGETEMSAAFVVKGTLRPESDVRCSFAFKRVELQRADGSTFGVAPPFGSGFFDTVYCDDTLRVSRDSRGDTLIVSRERVPWPRPRK